MLPNVDIEANLKRYIEGEGGNRGIQPLERYASFDYCFNYFQLYREQNALEKLASSENIERSCMQLGFYLASWGMLRGSAFLLQKSAKVYEPLIRAIVQAAPRLWEIDANCYTDANINILFDFKRQVIFALHDGSDILVTKIMLGVFGNIPAFDGNFKDGFRVSTFGRGSLKKIANYYDAHQNLIDGYRLPTFDFVSGQPTSRRYTRAKVIDMIFFIEGSKPRIRIGGVPDPPEEGGA